MHFLWRIIKYVYDFLDVVLAERDRRRYTSFSSVSFSVDVSRIDYQCFLLFRKGKQGGEQGYERTANKD